ncbi:MAG TPA: IS1380 family transposase [Acidimicrobiales bacterium]|nr:IS1380 family transposase [Acidimicrobiales bacterium]
MSVAVATTNRAITAFGGAELLREAARAVGLPGALEESLSLKRRARGLSDPQFALSIAESVALGALCLDDLAVTRADPAQAELRGFEVPAPQTAGSWLRRFSLGHVRQLDKALAQAQHNAYVAGGAKAVTLDFDSTYVFSRSRRRQGADRTYKKRYALHPLLCFDSGTGAAVHARLRRGSAGASKGISSFVAEALRAVPEPVAVRARFDSGFFSGPLFCQLERSGVSYLCGVPLVATVLAAAAANDEGYWGACLGTEGEVSEFGYRMKAGPFRRYIVKRVQVPAGRQASLWEGGYRYWVFVTNDHLSEPARLEKEFRDKATVETGMAELKSNFGLHAFRKHGFMANWAWLLIVCLGHNLCCWAQHLGALCGGRQDGELRAKRLRYRYLVIPAMLVRSGRRLVLRFQATYPFYKRFVAALGRLRSFQAA